jgi:hypothetical protein
MYNDEVAGDSVDHYPLMASLNPRIPQKNLAQSKIQSMRSCTFSDSNPLSARVDNWALNQLVADKYLVLTVVYILVLILVLSPRH